MGESSPADASEPEPADKPADESERERPCSRLQRAVNARRRPPSFFTARKKYARCLYCGPSATGNALAESEEEP